MNSAISFHADESIITPRVEVDPVVLTIHFHEPGQHAEYAAMDVKIFGTLAQFLDLGYAIIKAVREKEPPIDFGESLEAGLPFAIHDAEEAVDPDLAERL